MVGGWLLANVILHAWLGVYAWNAAEEEWEILNYSAVQKLPSESTSRWSWKEFVTHQIVANLMTATVWLHSFYHL